MQTGQHGCTERCKGGWQGCSIGAAAGDAAEDAAESRGLQWGIHCRELQGYAQAAPGRGRQCQPCAHLWALPASRHPTHGCPARPAVWRRGWTRRGCSPLPRPCGRRPTGCLWTRETRWHGGAAHIGGGHQHPSTAPAPAPRQPSHELSNARHHVPATTSSPPAVAGQRHPWVQQPPCPPLGIPTSPTQPQPLHLPGTGTGSPISAMVRAGPAHTSPSWALAQLCLCRHSSVPCYPWLGGHSPTWPQASGARLASSAPWAQSCMVQGTACPVPFCPMGTACPIHLCPMSRACPVPPLSHGHSLLQPMAEHHLSRHSSALSPSVPRAQPARCPLPIPQAQPAPWAQPAAPPLPRGTAPTVGPAPAGACRVPVGAGAAPA